LRSDDILLQQVEAVEGEEDRYVPAQRGGGRAEDEGGIGPVQGALGGDDRHRRRPRLFALAQGFFDLLRQQFFEATIDQFVDACDFGSGAHFDSFSQI
jgi:hypothetical protein